MWTELFEAEVEKLERSKKDITAVEAVVEPAPDNGMARTEPAFFAEEKWDETGKTFFVGCWLALLVSGAMWLLILRMIYRALA